MSEIDYRKLGLKVGLEIHQQLDVGAKLFCSCPSTLSDSVAQRVPRRLRPTRSEVGDVDPAALFEWRRGRVYEYETGGEYSCLVEADEEPPHELNREALKTVVSVALALGSRVVDEVYVMRKIVIDGSNTSGFQRTALVALGGQIEVGDKIIPIETICLEEDAARKVDEKGRVVTYRLDRLGIPLIEIATAPVIETPEEAAEVALAIGRLLRLTRRVKRGIGTIRQDLNVSIAGGAKTEIKGVQRLELIPKIIKNEVQRQLSLLKIKEELEKRGLAKSDLSVAPVDLTSLLSQTKSGVIRRALERGGVVLGVKLPKMRGVLGWEVMQGRRFGSEVADYVRFWSGASGIIHRDELPAYGITLEEAEAIARALGCGEEDGFIIVADQREVALKAIEVAIERVKAALDGVPEETRMALDDGTTRYMRPRPGAARMYPETDIPPVPVTRELLEEAEKIKPEPLKAKLQRLVEKHGLSRELALEVLRDLRLDLIEEMIERYGEKVPPKTIASLFVVVLRGLKSKGLDVETVSDEVLREVVEMLAEGSIAKEAVERILEEAARSPGVSAREIARKLGLTALTVEEAEAIVDSIVREYREEVAKRGQRAVGFIMGKAMEKLRGRIDGKVVAEIVNRKVEEALRGG
ncbi:MAG: Glu-tRNA(Gln) amidotransferase subunit GatE [Acidilobaceae archaeon]